MSRWSFIKVSCNTHKILCITRELGDLLIVGCTRTARCWNSLCSEIPESESTIDSLSQDSFLDAKKIHQIFLVLLDLILRNKFFWIFQFLDNLWHFFLGEAYFSILVLHTGWFSFWNWSAHRLAWCNWIRWDSKSWLISLKAMSEFLFFSSQLLPPLHTVFTESFLFLERPSQLFVQGFWKMFLYWMNGVLILISSLLTELKIVVATDFLFKFAPASWMTASRLTISSLFRRSFT